MSRFSVVLVLASTLVAAPVAAAPAAGDDVDEAMLRAAIAVLAPNAVVDEIGPAPIPGLYEVRVGPTLLYVSADGKFLIEGDIYDIEQKLNLTEAKRKGARAQAVEGLGEENMMVFSPENPKHTITVFTDIECGYCRKLHREMGQYNDAGIKIRYLMYPRAGVRSEAYTKAVSSWCADDPKAALTKAKQGQPIEERNCPNPILQHMAMGEALGVTGTPTIVLDDGEVIPGYVPAARLSRMLDARAAN